MGKFKNTLLHHRAMILLRIPQETLTIRQLSEVLQVSKQTARKIVIDLNIPSVFKRGRNGIVQVIDILEWQKKVKN